MGGLEVTRGIGSGAGGNIQKKGQGAGHDD